MNASVLRSGFVGACFGALLGAIGLHFPSWDWLIADAALVAVWETVRAEVRATVRDRDRTFR